MKRVISSWISKDNLFIFLLFFFMFIWAIIEFNTDRLVNQMVEIIEKCEKPK